MTILCASKFLYRSSNIDEKYFEKVLKAPPLPFDNAEYELRISGTVATDRRVMTFIDHLWGFEVTGGADQFEPLTILDVKRFVPIRETGLGYRAGIRKDDIITRINDTYADSMTLSEAQTMIRKSGRAVQIFVRGDDEFRDMSEYTVDLWFKPKKRFPPISIVNRWPDKYNWNDRNKPVYKESNCCLVPSPGDVREEPRRFERHVIEEERIKREQTPIVPTESDENKTETYGSQLSPSFKRPALKTHEEKERSRSRSRSPFVPTESDENKTEAYERSPTLQKAPTNAFSNGSTNVPSNHQ